MLPLARYRFHLRTESPLRLPVWAGSTLRGAFGHALRRLACMTRAPECPGCPLHSTCPYPGIFAPPPVDHTLQKFGQPPRPYIIEPAFWGESHFAVGDSLYFDLVLVGRALRELPLVALAWQRALAHGIGPGGGTATISTISKIAFDGESKVVFTIEDGIIQRHDTPAPQPPEPAVAGLDPPFGTPAADHALGRCRRRMDPARQSDSLPARPAHRAMAPCRQGDSIRTRPLCPGTTGRKFQNAPSGPLIPR